MLSVCFYPMKTQGMQEGRQTLYSANTQLSSALFSDVQKSSKVHLCTHLHDTQNGQSQDKPHGKHDDHEHDSEDTGPSESAFQGHVVEHFGELRVSEGQGPETKVGCAVRHTHKASKLCQTRTRRILRAGCLRIGNASQAEFDGMNDLVNDYVSHFERL